MWLYTSYIICVKKPHFQLYSIMMTLICCSLSSPIKRNFEYIFGYFLILMFFLDTLYKYRELGVLYVWVCLLWKERFYHVDDVWKCQSKFAILLLIFHLSFITFSVRVWKQDDTRMEDIIKYCNTLGNLMIVYGGVKIGNSPCRPFYTYRVIWTRLFAYKCDCRKIK